MLGVMHRQRLNSSRNWETDNFGQVSDDYVSYIVSSVVHVRRKLREEQETGACTQIDAGSRMEVEIHIQVQKPPLRTLLRLPIIEVAQWAAGRKKNRSATRPQNEGCKFGRPQAFGGDSQLLTLWELIICTW
mmetsp:Transcript_45789/g.178112  ORF Transcript_45789/g.178112 Transcript_45789/m.178112 type:complete len:132 (-) Transcript_45789:334-729(-)